jgi:hypothetical protein
MASRGKNPYGVDLAMALALGEVESALALFGLSIVKKW